MAGAEDIADLLDDDLFRASVRNIMAGIMQAERETGDMGNSALAIDALNYCLAVFLEANPEYAGLQGLAVAGANNAADFAMFLDLVRAQSEAQAQPMLETLTGGHTRQ